MLSSQAKRVKLGTPQTAPAFMLEKSFFTAILQRCVWQHPSSITYFLSWAIENLGMVMGPIGQTRVKKKQPKPHKLCNRCRRIQTFRWCERGCDLSGGWGLRQEGVLGSQLMLICWRVHWERSTKFHFCWGGRPTAVVKEMTTTWSAHNS